MQERERENDVRALRIDQNPTFLKRISKQVWVPDKFLGCLLAWVRLFPSKCRPKHWIFSSFFSMFYSTSRLTMKNKNHATVTVNKQTKFDVMNLQLLLKVSILINVTDTDCLLGYECWSIELCHFVGKFKLLVKNEVPKYCVVTNTTRMWHSIFEVIDDVKVT